MRVPRLLILLLLAPACRDGRLQGRGCRQDSDCGPAAAFRCETQTAVCYCRTDAACPPAQFCNLAGFCQDRSGCERNEDCLDSALFCDTRSGGCMPRGRCTEDLHCPLGQVCDLALTRCVDGCRSHGDCPGSSCRCGDKPCACTAQTPGEQARCQVGVCDPDFCANDTFCKFGEKCAVPPDAGATLPQCYSDFDPDRRPYCANCVFGGGVEVCGTGPNYCLIDPHHPGSYYCGVDCSAGQSCPRGYNCLDVIVVYTRWRCTADDPTCPPDPSLPCSEDKDCKRGGTCVKPPGQSVGACAGKCRIREGAAFGFCSCQVDQDCAQQACGSGGECTLSRQKCITEQDCRPIHCVDFEGAGGCLIGENCKPANGLTCVQVQ